MIEFPNYVCMDSPEFLIRRQQGVVQMGSFVDHVRQPGVVGMYQRKPVFLWNNDKEKTALESGDVEAYFALRGFKNSVMDNNPPELPKITIP